MTDAAVEGLGDIAQPLRVVGLDMSLTASGVVVLNQDGTAEITTIKSVGKKDDDLTSRQRRLTNITTQIGSILKSSDPDLVVLEAPAFSKMQGHAHDRSGLWWTVVRLTYALGFPIVEVQPNLRAKYATGKGTAGKDEVLIAVTRRYPTVEPKNNNEADALVLAHIGFHGLGAPIDDLPKTHLAALDTIRWPKRTEATHG